MNTVRLSGRWRLWEQFAVRGAGFPAAGVLRLAPAGLAESADKFETGVALSGPAWDTFTEQFGAAAVDTAHELRAVAADPTFRAAVAWQNRAVLRSGIDPFLAWQPSVAGRTSMPRQREELVAHYWQRFCVKNDTIGFFGPVGWGQWDLSQHNVTVEPGTGLIAATNVYFASWAIDAVANTIAPGKHWIAPRRVPFVRLDGDHMCVPGRSPVAITRELARVFERCDGIRTAPDLQRELGIDVTGALEELERRRFVLWRLDVPAGTHPERWLRTWLAGVGDQRLREHGLRLLDVLERGRDRVRTTTDPELLPVALSTVESDFAALTGAGARTKSTKTAPGRGLVYADCVRSARVRLGREVLDALAPLDLLLTSATWLTEKLANTVLRHAHEIYDRLGSVDLATFWFACMPVLHGDVTTEAVRLRRELTERWSRIVATPDTNRVRLSTVDIADKVDEQFGEPEPGWTMARYACPDVFRTGTDELVLGELHVAANTLGASLFVNQHPAPAELLAQTHQDHPEPRLMPLLPKEHRARLSTRIRNSLVREDDYQIALLDDTADPSRTRTVRSADVTVTRRGDRLLAVLPDGAEFDLVDVFAHNLTTLVLDHFQIMPEAAHTPRVTIDRLVVARESWRFEVRDLRFAAEKNEARRFVHTRQWRDSMELPRFVFVVSPAEPRPFYVDFDAPVYVNIFTKAVRRLSRVDPRARLTVTEMLPTPEQAWLTDDKGHHYSSELRFVAVERELA